MKKDKTEIEKLIDVIYHKQTYGKNADKEIEKLNLLTSTKPALKKPSQKKK